jgi:hypothetical protein
VRPSPSRNRLVAAFDSAALHRGDDDTWKMLVGKSMSRRPTAPPFIEATITTTCCWAPPTHVAAPVSAALHRGLARIDTPATAAQSRRLSALRIIKAWSPKLSGTTFGSSRRRSAPPFIEA